MRIAGSNRRRTYSDGRRNAADLKRSQVSSLTGATLPHCSQRGLATPRNRLQPGQTPTPNVVT